MKTALIVTVISFSAIFLRLDANAIAAFSDPTATCQTAGMKSVPIPNTVRNKAGRLSNAQWVGLAQYYKAISAVMKSCANKAVAFQSTSAHDGIILSLANASANLNMAAAFYILGDEISKGRALQAQVMASFDKLSLMPMSDDTRHNHLDGYIADAKKLQANPQSLSGFSLSP